MTITQSVLPPPRKPLRLWPGVFAAVLGCLIWIVFPIVQPENAVGGMLGAIVCGLVVVVWWLLFSRAPWLDRLGALLVMIIAVIALRPVVHPSITGAGQGMLFNILAIPVMSFALVAWAVATRRLSSGLRRSSMVAALLLACAAFTLARTDGVDGDGNFDVHWRWTPTPEEQLLAQAPEPPALPSAPVAAEAPKQLPAAQPGDKLAAPAAAKSLEERPAAKAGDKPAALPSTPLVTKTEAEWPGFRGPHRDSIISGVRIETNWSSSPPKELWRRLVGPGWSSFAVRGDLLYTQEQRGDHEIVACYNTTTGKPVWEHRDAARFWESNAGAGPRGTPTLSGERLYTFGATGIVNALDAANGAVVWSRNVTADTNAKVPYWGFASSPLVVDDMVVIAASGRLVAYDLATGKPRWVGAKAGGSYSSPHLMTIDGVAQILLLSNDGATSVAPADGKLLWKHPWEGAIMLQPAMTADGDLLITTSDMSGGVAMRRIAVSNAPGGWTVKERWTSRALKPYYNDYVVHKGHAFGFDGSILACIDLKDGERKWKGGRYGHGQLVLLPDQDLLLVLSEEGEVALVSAATDKFTELARLPAIEGKTWNHPALVRDLLLVRNDREMAAFRLQLTKGSI